MAEVLYGHAAEAAGLRGRERVFDLYCGIGTIGLSLAARAREVVGVEIVEAAVSDAIENARLNEITNASFYAGDIRLAMRELVERAGKPDVAVIDPPRAGLSQKVVRRIIEAAPQRIVYVSCNPTTLAPNAAQLVEAGWALKRVQPVDMFPQTPHIECVALLEKRMSLTRVTRFGSSTPSSSTRTTGSRSSTRRSAAAARRRRSSRRRPSWTGRSCGSRSPTPTRTTSAGSTRSPRSCRGVEVSISTRDARLLAKDKTTDPGEPPDAKLRGGYPGAKTQPTRTLVGRRPRRLARGHRRAGPHPRPRRLPRHPRPHADRRRRLLDARRRRHDREGQPALPAARHSPPGTARPRSRPPARCARSTRPASRSATARPSRRPAPRWTPRSRRPRAPRPLRRGPPRAAGRRGGSSRSRWRRRGRPGR